MLQRRVHWRQVDLARRSRVSQQAVSLVETGQWRRLSFATLERMLAALEAEVEIVVRWRGGELDRIVDEAHAAVTAAIVELLASCGWRVAVEVTYAFGRERGSIDVLGLHPDSRAILVVEVKVDVTAAESTLRRHDEKARLARRIAIDRFGWKARASRDRSSCRTLRRRAGASAPMPRSSTGCIRCAVATFGDG